MNQLSSTAENSGLIIQLNSVQVLFSSNTVRAIKNSASKSNSIICVNFEMLLYVVHLKLKLN